MLDWLLIGVILGIGFLTGQSKENRYVLFKACVHVLVQCVIGMALFSVGVFVAGKILSFEVGTTFTVMLFAAIIIGIVLYWAMIAVEKKLTFQITVITLAEYIIQWSLVYLTMYQVIFENLVQGSSIAALESIDVSNPSELLLILLPALMSSWIANILYKLKHKAL